jgi:hypothetical protein
LVSCGGANLDGDGVSAKRIRHYQSSDPGDDGAWRVPSYFDHSLIDSASCIMLGVQPTQTFPGSFSTESDVFGSKNPPSHNSLVRTHERALSQMADHSGSR